MSDTNHREPVLLHIVKNRQALEACCDIAEYDLELSVDYLHVNVFFFGKHKGHRLGVKCEYESLEQAKVRFEKNLTWDQFREEQRA